jgi:hypothetical protein
MLNVLLGACAVLLVATSGVRAATAVDLYQDMAGGHDGDLLTPAIMNASAHPGTLGWGLNGGPWFVSSRNARSLPGPVIVDGVMYSGTGATHSWMLNNSNAMNYVSGSIGTHAYAAITVAFYYTTGRAAWPRNYVIYDTVTIAFLDGTYACMQTINQGSNGPYGKGPYLRAHSRDLTAKTTYSPAVTPIVAGKTYWINLNYNAAGTNVEGSFGTVSLATFDPDNGFAQVGSTIIAPSRPDKAAWHVMFGRTDNHGNETNDLAQSWFSHILIDYSHATFPLIPAGTNAAPPRAATAK